MMLTDTGPLVALMDRNDFQHAACVAAARQLLPGPLLTTWPCFTEAMYLLGEVGGYRYQAEIWKMIESQRLKLHDLSDEEIQRIGELMEKYQDTPMDLADASLVALAESHSLDSVFSLDSDFRFYRLKDGSVLDIVP